MARTRRAEILFNDEEYERLRLEAERREVSIGELLRDAVHRVYLGPADQRRRTAIRRLLEREAADLGDWQQAKGSIGRWVDEDVP